MFTEKITKQHGNQTSNNISLNSEPNTSPKDSSSDLNSHQLLSFSRDDSYLSDNTQCLTKEGFEDMPLSLKFKSLSDKSNKPTNTLQTDQNFKLEATEIFKANRQDSNSLIYNKRISSSSTTASLGSNLEFRQDLYSKNDSDDIVKYQNTAELLVKDAVDNLEAGNSSRRNSYTSNSSNTGNNSEANISQNLPHNVQASNIDRSFSNNELNESRENNLSTTEDANNSETTLDLITTIDFVIEKMPILRTILLLISLSLFSGTSIAFMDGEYSHSFLFIILYITFLYGLAEKMFKLLRIYHLNGLSSSDLKHHEQFHDIVDNINLIFIALAADLRLSNKIESMAIGLCLLIGAFFMYKVYCHQTTGLKALGMLKRSLLIIQVGIVDYKVNDELKLSWSFVLFLGWIVLISGAIKLLNKLKQIIVSFRGQNLLSNLSKSSKAIVITMIILFLIDLSAVSWVFFQFCNVLDAEADNTQQLRFSLTITQYLNAFILIFATVCGSRLIEFIYTADEQQDSIDATLLKKKLVLVTKENYMLKISPTYYKVLNEDKHSEFLDYIKTDSNIELFNKDNFAQLLEDFSVVLDYNEEDEDASEEESCYICYSKKPDGVIVDCGHGGVCYDCTEDYVKSKDGCMECRKEIKSIAKIEDRILLGKVYKSSKICRVIKTI